MHPALISFQLLACRGGTRSHPTRDFCQCDAVNVELCSRFFLSGWRLFVGSIVGACIFHWLTQNVPIMRGWWERASTPIGILIYASGAAMIVLSFVASRV